MIFLIVLHVIVCVALIGLVLIQRGRGGGLVESFSGVESMFGTKTSAFLTRTTTILSVIFFITCLSLAVLSVRQSKSLMRNVKPKTQAEPEKPAPATGLETEGDIEIPDEIEKETLIPEAEGQQESNAEAPKAG